MPGAQWALQPCLLPPPPTPGGQCLGRPWPVDSITLPPQLLWHLRKVRFQTPDGTEIMFDANGDLVSKFDILQGQKTPEGLFHLVQIGEIDPRASSGSRMTVHLQEDVQVSCPGTWVTVLESLSWRETWRPGSLSPRGVWSVSGSSLHQGPSARQASPAAPSLGRGPYSPQNGRVRQAGAPRPIPAAQALRQEDHRSPASLGNSASLSQHRKSGAAAQWWREAQEGPGDRPRVEERSQAREGACSLLESALRSGLPGQHLHPASRALGTGQPSGCPLLSDGVAQCALAHAHPHAPTHARTPPRTHARTPPRQALLQPRLAWSGPLRPVGLRLPRARQVPFQDPAAASRGATAPLKGETLHPTLLSQTSVSPASLSVTLLSGHWARQLDPPFAGPVLMCVC